MRIINNGDINRQKWDELVYKTDSAGIYNLSTFLDNLAENWHVIVVGDYEAGLALPFSVRMGVYYLYTPNFIRTLDWLGEKPSKMRELEEMLSEHFQRFDFRISNLTFSHSSYPQSYQTIDSGMIKGYTKQAKRGLKKFDKSQYELREIKIEDAFPIIMEELADKVKTLRKVDLDRFTLNYSNIQNVIVFGVFDKLNLGAAAIFVEWKNEILYIKGGAIEIFKNDGAMYGLMHAGIELAKSKELSFNFEGSTVEGVRNFNLHFGADEKFYYNWKWTRAPFWFRFLLKIKGHE